jgi:hypothetical protein
MRRTSIATLFALLAMAAVARAGGPPPVYVVVDKVVLEPKSDAPDRMQIWGSFTRIENRSYDHFSKPVYGYVDLSIDPAKQAESRAEWAKWQQAAGTGKAVAVGSCGEAGAFLNVAIHQPKEKQSNPDAVYVPGQLERFGDLYARGEYDSTPHVKELLSFAKQRREEAQAAERAQR